MNKLFLALLVFATTAYGQVQVSRTVERTLHLNDTTVIHEPGAAWIKLHFSEVNAPIKVRSPDRREQYVYTPNKKDNHTRHGKNLGAMSIHGDTVIVEFLGNGSATVVRYDVGLPQALGVIESTCGVDDKEWIACFDDPVYERRRPVAKLIVGNSACTAWRLGPGNKMLTNWHCMDTNSAVAGSEVWFQHEYSGCEAVVSEAIPPVKIPGEALLDTFRDYDYTLFTAKDSPELQQFGWYGVEARQASEGDGIYMIGHPSAQRKRGIVQSTENASGLCEIDDDSRTGFVANSDYGYHCDSRGGQSGSPVIDAGNNRAIGLHHFGWGGTGECINAGVKMANIWPRISGFFDGVPVGDNEGDVDPPVAELSISCVDNLCDYSAAGSVADTVLWTFGDGTESTAFEGQHTYDATAFYTVHLYATYNGLTDVDSTTIAVSLPGENFPPDVEMTVTDEGNYVGHFVADAVDPDGEIVDYHWAIHDCGDLVEYFGVSELRHTFQIGGQQRAHVTVTDNEGATDRIGALFEITGPVMNETPVADFQWEQVDSLTIQFTSTATDDVGIEHYQWYFGDDDVLGGEQNPIHTYQAEGTYSVLHYVYDECFSADTTTKDVVVTSDDPDPCGDGVCAADEDHLTCPADCPDPCGNGVCDDGEDHLTCPADCPAPPSPITLSYTAQRIHGPNYLITLNWEGAVGDSITIHRGSSSEVSGNDGIEEFEMHKREKKTVFQICDDTQCSDPVSVDF